MIRPQFMISLRDWTRAMTNSAAVTAITAIAMAGAYGVLTQIPHGHLAALVTFAVVGLSSWWLGIRLTGHIIGPELRLWLEKAIMKLRLRK